MIKNMVHAGSGSGTSFKVGSWAFKKNHSGIRNTGRTCDCCWLQDGWELRALLLDRCWDWLLWLEPRWWPPFLRFWLACSTVLSKPVLRIRIRIWIRIHRIHMFLGLLDPDPSARGMDPVPDLDPSITKQKKVRKTLIPTALRLLFDFLPLKIMYLKKVPNRQKNFFLN